MAALNCPDACKTLGDAHFSLKSSSMDVCTYEKRERERETKTTCRHIITIIIWSCDLNASTFASMLTTYYAIIMCVLWLFERSQETQVKRFHFMSCCLLNLAVLVPENSAARNDPKRCQCKVDCEFVLICHLLFSDLLLQLGTNCTGCKWNNFIRIFKDILSKEVVQADGAA